MAIDVNISGLNTVVDVTMAETALIDAESGQVITIEDYDNLSHKPSINSVTLSGNKTSSDIGVADAVHTHTKSQITDFPSLSTVATSGSYNDLTDTPTIPDAVTVTQITSTGTNIADIDIGGVTTHLYAPSGGGGATAFEAEFNVTTYADVKDAYDNDAIIICTADDSGNTKIFQLAYFDDGNSIFYFAEPTGDGWDIASVSENDGWDNGIIPFASTDTATQLRDGLMSALDKQKLDGIASGAEVNVQSDWSQSDNTKDDFIKNKPAIPTVPTDISAFNNDVGYITGYTETDPVFSASAASGITSSDISDWNSKSKVSVTRHTTSGTNIADLTIDGTTTKLYAPTGGGGTITDVEVNGTSVVTGGVAEIDLTGKSDVGHTHTTSAITDFPSLATVATSGDYDDLIDKPTIPTVNDATLTIQKNGTDVQTFTANASSNVTANITVPTDTGDLTNTAGFITSPNIVYCTCATEQSTVAKVATIVSGTLTTLTTGAQAIVKFTNANAATNPTLQVGSTAAKSIKRYGTSAPSTSSAGSWNGGSCIYFVYDGSYWQMIGFLNSTYSAISKTNIESSSSTSTGLITGQRAAQAVAKHESVSDVTVGGTSVMSGKTAVIPAIPTDTGDLTNGAGFITGYTETDPVFTASDAYGIVAADITNWNDKVDRATGDFDLDTSAVSGDDYNLTQALTDIGWLSDVTYTP